MALKKKKETLFIPRVEMTIFTPVFSAHVDTHEHRNSTCNHSAYCGSNILKIFVSVKSIFSIEQTCCFLLLSSNTL